MSSLSTVLLQELKSRFPDVDWAVGSVIRELLAEPAMRLGVTADAYLTEAATAIDIIALSARPAQYADKIDEWADRLGIVLDNPTASPGTVRIFIDGSPENLSVLEGTSFTWGTTRLSAAETTTWSVDGFGATQRLESIGPESYVAEVPVVAVENGEVSLSSGAAVNWLGAPAVVYDVRVGEPISGGRMSLTTAEKAAAILSFYQPASFGGRATINATLRKSLPIVVNSAAVARKTDAVVGEVGVYVKTVRGPGRWEVEAEFEDVGGEVRTVLPAAGAYAVRSVLTYGRTSIPFTSTAENNRITIALPGGAGEGTYTVVLEGLKDIETVQEVLDEAAAGTPYKMYARTPLCAALRINVRVLGGGSSNQLSEAVTAIQRHISSLPIGVTYISDFEISAVLNAVGLQLSGQCQYAVYSMSDNRSDLFTSTGSIDLGAWAVSADIPIALYAYDNEITVRSV